MNSENKKLGKSFWCGKNKVLAIVIGGIVIATSLAVWASVQNIGERSISEKNPFFGTTMDYYVPLANLPVKIMACYDDTDVHIDYNGDGVWDTNYTIETYGTTITLSNLPASAHIQGSKPLVVWMEKSDNINPRWGSKLDDWKWMSTIPTASELGTQYLVPSSGTLYVTTIYSATYVQADTDGDGAYDIEGYVAPGHPLELSVNNGALINSNKPTVVSHYVEYYYEYGFGCDITFLNKASDIFYLPFGDKPYIVTALQDSTLISLDANLDGIADEQYTLDARESMTLSGYSSRTKVYSDKPITVVCQKSGYVEPYGGDKAYIYEFPIMSGNRLGMDFFIRESAYVAAIYSNTTVYFDGDNDGIYESNETLLITQPQTYTSFHIHTNKPVGVYFYGEGIIGTPYGYYACGDVCPAATLGTTMDVTPNEIGLNEDVKEHITIANPTETNVTNITLAAYIPDSFSVNNPLTVNIEKKSLYTDTIIASDSITINLTQSSGYYEIAMSKYNTSLFNELENHYYFYITFNATSPSTEAVYSFKEVEVTYDATTWVD